MPIAQSGAIAMGENVVIRSIMFFVFFWLDVRGKVLCVFVGGVVN